MEGLKHNSHSVGQNCFRLVWKVKYAYSFLNRLHLKECVEGIIKLIAFEKGGEIFELKVMPDHVHCFRQGNSKLLALRGIALLFLR